MARFTYPGCVSNSNKLRKHPQQSLSHIATSRATIQYLFINSFQTVFVMTYQEMRFHYTCDYSQFKAPFLANAEISRVKFELDCFDELRSFASILLRDKGDKMWFTTEERELHKKAPNKTYDTNVVNIVLRARFCEFMQKVDRRGGK